MADKNQIMIVKTIRKRLIELLGDSKVTVTVSYTSASDMLRLTFKKLLKGAAFELPICTSMKEYLLNPETLQYIVTDALAKMPQPPKWTMEIVLAELRRRYEDYAAYASTIRYPHRNAASIGVGLTSIQNATEAYYTICGGPTARRLDCSTSDLDHFESSFERDAGILSAGEYTQWREAGEPKHWTDPDSQGMFNWAELVQNMGPIGMSTNSQSMRYYTFNSLGGPLAAPPTQEPTHE